MKVTLRVFAIVLLGIIQCSCMKDEEVYSCNQDADVWVKSHLSSVQAMNRSKWLALKEPEVRKRAAYVAFTPNGKKEFWVNKISEVLNQFEWNEEEQDHLSTLLSYLRGTDIFSQKGADDDFEIFIYRWNDYAINELHWSKKLIYAITANGDKLSNKEGDLIASATVQTESGQPNAINTRSEEESWWPECSCSKISDYCDVFGEIPSWVVSCNSNNYNCRAIPGCGSFWQFTCDGICKAPIA